MAPQASIVAATPTIFSTPAPAGPDPKPWVPIPVALSIFLGLCLSYTLSYILYRFVMSRRRGSEDDTPVAPDRGVSQFMNGARLTLNLGHHHKSTPLTLDVSPDMLEEEKPLTDSSHPAHSETPASSPADPSSSPFIILMPSFTIHTDQEPAEALPQEQRVTEPEPDPSTAAPPALPSAQSQQPFSQRVAAKVKSLSRARAEAIAQDPKLAPVQGPLRPLSMISSPSRKKGTNLFGLGLKHSRGHDAVPDTDSEAR